MSSFRIRPRFKHVQPGTSSELEEQILEAIKTKDQFIATHVPGNLYIKIDPKEQHFWSPQLNLTFEQDNEEVIIRGLYGPNPTLWAVFFFSYVALGILSLFLGMWGLTRWSLGMSSYVLWSVPVFAVIATLLYFAAQAGQKLGAQQLFDIHHLYEEIIGDRVPVE